MSSHAEQYTLYQLANAPLREYPFPHILVRDVFEPAFYRRLLEHILPANLMRPIKEVRRVGKDYSDQRFAFTLTPEEIATLPPRYGAFWGELSAWLRAAPFAVAVFNKFGRAIHERFGAQSPACYSEAMLVEDRTRYSLGPHSDRPSKIVSLVFYLPADDARPHLGTSLYAPRDASFRCAGGPHYPFELFHRVVTMPYLPNTLFAFVKTDNSFHGVEPIADTDYRRHLLFYDVKCDLRVLAKPEAQEDASAAAKPGVEFTF